MDVIERKIEADRILMSEISDDEKLYKIFELYKNDLSEQYPRLYYALLGWKNHHISKIRRYK